MEGITEEQAIVNEVPNVSLGEIVHYVLSDGRSKGEHRPAIVVRDWGEGMVNIQVLPDGSNDFMGRGRDGDWGFIVWKTSVHYSQEPLPGTWHRIEKA